MWFRGNSKLARMDPTKKHREKMVCELSDMANWSKCHFYQLIKAHILARFRLGKLSANGSNKLLMLNFQSHSKRIAINKKKERELWIRINSISIGRNRTQRDERTHCLHYAWSKIAHARAKTTRALCFDCRFYMPFGICRTHIFENDERNQNENRCLFDGTKEFLVYILCVDFRIAIYINI